MYNVSYTQTRVSQNMCSILCQNNVTRRQLIFNFTLLLITKGVGGEPSEPALQSGFNLAKKEMIRSFIRLICDTSQSSW